MFALERIRVITNLLAETKQVEVHSLSRMLNVSEVTIRRDLEKLETQGILIRTHGGAVQKEDALHPLVNSEYPDNQTLEMARIAVHMIEDGDTILLTAGETGMHIARELRIRSGVTVLTNSIPAALSCVEQVHNRVVLLGGDLLVEESSLYGSLCMGNLRRFHVQKIFAEIDGVDQDLNLFTTSNEKTEFLESAFQISDQTIYLCRPGVFGERAFCRLMPASQPLKLITGSSLPEVYKTLCFSRNIQLYTSIDLFEGRV